APAPSPLCRRCWRDGARSRGHSVRHLSCRCSPPANHLRLLPRARRCRRSILTHGHRPQTFHGTHAIRLRHLRHGHATCHELLARLDCRTLLHRYWLLPPRSSLRSRHPYRLPRPLPPPLLPQLTFCTCRGRFTRLSRVAHSCLCSFTRTAHHSEPRPRTSFVQ